MLLASLRQAARPLLRARALSTPGGKGGAKKKEPPTAKQKIAARASPKPRPPAGGAKQAAKGARPAPGGRKPAGRGGPPAKAKRDAPARPPRVTDVLETSVRFVDDVDGAVVRKLPKGGEVPLGKAVSDFVRRDMAVPGPYTIYYVPPGARPETPAAPRPLDDLVAYTTETQYAPPADAPGPAKDTVDAAWQILAKQPYVTEPQKRKIMAKVHHTMGAIDGDDALVKLFTLPETLPEAAAKPKGPPKRKKRPKA